MMMLGMYVAASMGTRIPLQRLRLSNCALIFCDRDALYDRNVLCGLSLNDPARDTSAVWCS
jgi:hypothetical protein